MICCAGSVYSIVVQIQPSKQTGATRSCSLYGFHRGQHVIYRSRSYISRISALKYLDHEVGIGDLSNVCKLAFCVAGDHAIIQIMSLKYGWFEISYPQPTLQQNLQPVVAASDPIVGYKWIYCISTAVVRVRTLYQCYTYTPYVRSLDFQVPGTKY